MSAPRPRRRGAGPPRRPAATAGYSGAPLVRKLGIAAGARVHVTGAPPHYRELLAPLPERVRFSDRVGKDTDLVHAFVHRRRELAALLPRLRRNLDPASVAWISWPKRASGVATDLTEEAVRELALPLGFVDVKVCAVDAVWSGLKLVVRRELR